MNLTTFNTFRLRQSKPDLDALTPDDPPDDPLDYTVWGTGVNDDLATTPNQRTGYVAHYHGRFSDVTLDGLRTSRRLCFVWISTPPWQQLADPVLLGERQP